MKKTKLSILSLFVLSLTLLVACGSGDEETTTTAALTITGNKWIVTSNSTVTDITGGGSVDVTAEFSDYYVEFIDGTGNFSMKTFDSSGNYVVTVGTYSAEANGGTIIFASGSPFLPEAMVGYMFDTTSMPATLSFQQDVIEGADFRTIVFSNLEQL